jgi:hypothetical protein
MDTGESVASLHVLTVGAVENKPAGELPTKVIAMLPGRFYLHQYFK